MIESFGMPHTRTGHMSLYGPPPWHLTGRCLAVWFRVAEPAALRNHIHERLDLGPDPVVGARFWDLRHDAGRPDLVRERGSLFRMREASIAIPVQFDGVRGDDTVYMWADEPRYTGYAREVMGWPVIHGALEFTDTPAVAPESDSSPDGLPADSWPRPHLGDVVSATLTYEGRPTMSMSLKLLGESTTSSASGGPQWITHRFFPDVLGAGRVDQIVMTKPGSASLGPIWAAEASFELTGAPGSGLEDLRPVSIQRAELWSELDLTIAEGRLLGNLAVAPAAAATR
jgi:acetoacetate decarboxylase